jgi:hypothetical protein
MGTATVQTTTTKEATVPAKRTAAKVQPPAPPPPEPLIRLAFKESDLKLLIDALEPSLTPAVTPIFHRLKMRYSEHVLKSL